MISSPTGLAAVLGMFSLVLPVQGQPPKDYRGDCTKSGCHDAFAKRSVIHPPAEPGGCDTCHEASDEKKHRFKLTMEGGELCEDCHDAFEGKVTHDPAAQGQCTACHDPHSSDAAHLLKAETQAELCAECHDDFSEDFKYLHGPVGAGVCTVCHDPHASDHPRMLSADQTTKVCAECHAELQARISSQAFKHQPATEDCTSCHDPHGADNRMNLKSRPPELCIECHDEIGDTIEDATVAHDAVTTGKSCVGCHDPHASAEQHGLLHQPMALCLSCHDRELNSGTGKITNMARLLEENPEHHGPIREKNCTACHQQIHGGDHFRLLMKEYPSEFYASFEEERYALCFECHEPDLVKDEQTDKLTNFRNGKQNLHYLHVNRKVKGRTCRACHDIHASRKPRHIAESVPFGKWNLPLNYLKATNGGSCRPGCHKEYRYDRITPVVNVAP